MIGKMGKAAYDRMTRTIALEMNIVRDRHNDLLSAVRKHYGKPLDKIGSDERAMLFEALAGEIPLGNLPPRNLLMQFPRCVLRWMNSASG